MHGCMGGKLQGRVQTFGGNIALQLNTLVQPVRQLTCYFAPFITITATRGCSPIGINIAGNCCLNKQPRFPEKSLNISHLSFCVEGHMTQSVVTCDVILCILRGFYTL